MDNDITIVGTPISPYVRKVLITLELKGIEFRCVPQVPFFPTDEFKEISPLKRIPVLKHGDFVLPDSSAIVQYFDELYPEISILPDTIQDRARARWLEEYADEWLGRSVVFNLFFQRVVGPLLLKQPSDEKLIKQALEVDIPKSLDYLEGVVPSEGYLFDEISIADLAVTGMFLNAGFAGWEIDATCWPKFAAYLRYVYAHPVVSKYNSLASKLRGLPHAEHQSTVTRFIAAS
ncbi:MAG: glutathione S-transferase family protein [Kordiimonas sp.]